MKMLLNVWRLNWPLVPYHSSNRYPCARLTRPSCIRGSNRSADVCRVAAILRAARLSWMEDIYYISKCVDMASACDIPRLVQCVLCTKTLLPWLLRDFDGYSDGPSTKGVEKERRAMKVQSSDIHFVEDMPVTVCQERFFKKQGQVYPCIG